MRLSLLVGVALYFCTGAPLFLPARIILTGWLVLSCAGRSLGGRYSNGCKIRFGSNSPRGLFLCQQPMTRYILSGGGPPSMVLRGHSRGGRGGN